MEEKKYSFNDLVEIMARLRGKNGCPWDIEQTHESLLQYLIEESAEFIDSVHNQDDTEMCEELGDVLLQVLFHARIAEEEQRFNISDIINEISAKMVHRHPHVFGELELKTSDDVLNRWDDFKKKEKEKKGVVEEDTSIMKNLPKSMPGLSLAKKIQNRAARIGFDWDKPEDVFPKIEEEIEEVKADVNNPEKLEEEIGDLLFAVVNLARKYDVDAELAMRKANEKFVNRFRGMEALDPELAGKSLDELDLLWNRVKKEK